jgi:hypothetical protein
MFWREVCPAAFGGSWLSSYSTADSTGKCHRYREPPRTPVWREGARFQSPCRHFVTDLNLSSDSDLARIEVAASKRPGVESCGFPGLKREVPGHSRLVIALTCAGHGPPKIPRSREEVALPLECVSLNGRVLRR